MSDKGKKMNPPYPKPLKSRKFVGSEQATDFVYDLNAMLLDPRLVEWARGTDSNFGANSLYRLKEAQRAYADFLQALADAS